MRRLMHLLIVALLCGSLGVDTAKACWFLRHRRPQTCRPSRCEPAGEPCCQVAAGVATDCVVADCVDGEHVAVSPLHSAQVHQPQSVASDSELLVTAPAAGDPPVVHGPTTVVGTPTPTRDPVSVVTTPTPESGPADPGRDSVAQATPTKASPMPLETAATQPAASQDEPLPRLKPAVTPDVAPASAEQPAGESPTPPAAPTQAPIDGLARPAVSPLAPTPAPREPNLFDLYEDGEQDADAPDAEADDGEEGEEMEPGESEDSEEEMDALDEPAGESDEDAASPEDSSPDAAEPARPRSRSAVQPRDTDTEVEPGDEPNTEPNTEPGTQAGDEPGDEPEEQMQETEDESPAADADSEESEEMDAEEEMNEDAAETDDSETEEADPAEESPVVPDAAPAEEPAAEESAAVSVPGEPLRRWTDATGREARGWLVSLSPESDGRRVRILKMNGRHATVAVDSLSEADKEYVSNVASRLAAASPGTGDTAGL